MLIYRGALLAKSHSSCVYTDMLIAVHIDNNDSNLYIPIDIAVIIISNVIFHASLMIHEEKPWVTDYLKDYLVLYKAQK